MSMTMISTSAPRAVVTGGDPAVMADPNASVVSTDRKVMGAPDEGVVQRSGSIPISVRTMVDSAGLQWVVPEDRAALMAILEEMTYLAGVDKMFDPWFYTVAFVGASPQSIGIQPSAKWFWDAGKARRLVLVQVDTIGTHTMKFASHHDAGWIAEMASEGGPYAIFDFPDWPPEDSRWNILSEARIILLGGEVVVDDDQILDDSDPSTYEKEIVEERTKDVPIVQAAAEPGLPSWVLPAAIGVTGAGVLYWLMTRRRSE